MDKAEPYLLSFFAVRQFPFLQNIKFRYFPTDSLIETIVSQKYICMLPGFYPSTRILSVDLHLSPSDNCNSLFFQQQFVETITSLNLSDVFLSTERFPSSIAFTNLERIDMFEISDDVFEYIIKQIAGCPNLRRFFSHHWMNKDFPPVLVQRSFVHLTRLPRTLEQCNITLQYPFFPEDDRTLLDMETYQRQVDVISLPQVTSLTFRFGIKAFTDLCAHFSFPRLQQLSIVSQKQDLEFSALGSVAHTLTKLSLSVHRDNIFSLITVLHSLNLLACLNIEVESPTLRYFAEIQPYLLGAVRIYKTYGRVSTSGLQAILRQNEALYLVLCKTPDQIVPQRHRQQLHHGLHPRRHRQRHHGSQGRSLGRQPDASVRMDPALALRALIALVKNPQAAYQYFLGGSWVGSSELSTLAFFEVLFDTLQHAAMLQYLAINVGGNFFQPSVKLDRLLNEGVGRLKQVLLNFQNYEHDMAPLSEGMEITNSSHGSQRSISEWGELQNNSGVNEIESARGAFMFCDYGIIPKIPNMVELNNGQLVLYDLGLRRQFLQEFNTIPVAQEDILQSTFEGWI